MNIYTCSSSLLPLPKQWGEVWQWFDNRSICQSIMNDHCIDLVSGSFIFSLDIAYFLDWAARCIFFKPTIHGELYQGYQLNDDTVLYVVFIVSVVKWDEYGVVRCQICFSLPMPSTHASYIQPSTEWEKTQCCFWDWHSLITEGEGKVSRHSMVKHLFW